MASRSRRNRRTTNDLDDYEDIPLSGRMTLESITTFKVAKKKAKRRTKTTTVASTASASAGAASDLNGISDPPTPVETDLPLPHKAAISPVEPQYLDNITASPQSSPPPKRHEEGTAPLPLAQLEININTVSATILSIKTPQPLPVSPFEQTQLSVADSTNPRNTENMSTYIPITFPLPPPKTLTPVGRDDFDSLEWDPELPSGSAQPPDSPEPVSIKPQPVSYTTVGSIVDPAVKPRIAAPNRIQREGVGRSPLMSMLQRGGFDSFYQLRTAPPPLNRANSMAYAQYLARSPVNPRKPNDAFSASPSGPSPPTPPDQLLDHAGSGKRVLMQLMRGPQTISKNGLRSTNGPAALSANAFPIHGGTCVDKSMKIQQDNVMTRLHGMLKDSQNGQSTDAARELAKKDISIRQMLAKRATGSSSDQANTPVPQTPDSFASDFKQYLGLRNAMATPINNIEGRGELNRGYKFPPSNVTSSVTAVSNISALSSQTNPLLSVYSAPPDSSKTGLTLLPGYPQPLTAGPPGQRQYPISQARLIPVNTEKYVTKGQTFSSFNCHATGKLSASSLPHGVVNNYRYQDLMPAKVVDTLSPHDAAKYYPSGYPANMTGEYTPVASVTPVASKPDLDTWFYGEQRRFATMTSEDYIKEMKGHSSQQTKNPLGPIGPPSKTLGTGPAVKRLISREEMAKMTIGEAARPLLTVALGSLLAWTESGPNSRQHLSKFHQAPEDKIDQTFVGRQSVFGEDWGPAPNHR